MGWRSSNFGDSWLNEAMLELEYKTYERQKPTLIAKDEHRWVLIKGTKVAGVFDTSLEAFERGIAMFGNVPMLVKQIEHSEAPVFIGQVEP
jgi:hypothetical protein